MFLLLDGVLLVEKDGERLAEYGPGAMLGERAHLEESGRTSSLIAVTPCRVAAVDAAALDRAALHELCRATAASTRRAEQRQALTPRRPAGWPAVAGRNAPST